MTASVKERLLSKTDITDNCWLFMGAFDEKGYGHIRDGSVKKAHRVSWEVHVGPIPQNLFVLHKCDKRNCVNPAHLYLGTQLDNMKDRDIRGRRASTKGSNHPGAVLSDIQVLAIRQSLHEGINIDDLAIKYKVTKWCILDIKNRRSWSHI